LDYDLNEDIYISSVTLESIHALTR
jgi:hypothetical protein